MFIIIIVLCCTINWVFCQPKLLNIPNSLDIPYSTGTALLSISLAKEPQDGVAVFFHVENVFFDICNVEFNQTNWNKPQTILATTLPYFTESDKLRVIQMKFKVFSENDREFDQKEYFMSITRSGAAGRICTSGGDPHYVGYNGARYDFQGMGCYYLVRSEFLIIQYIGKKWVNSAAVQKTLAIQYGKCVMIFDCEQEGQPIQTWNCDSSDGAAISQENRNNNVIISFSEGSKFKMYRRNNKMWYCDTEVQMAGHSVGKVGGVCGTMTENPRDRNFYDPNGNVVSGEENFGRTWACPGGNDLFTCASRGDCKPLKKRVPVSNCIIPDVNFWEDTPSASPNDNAPQFTPMKTVPYTKLIEVPKNEILENVPQPAPSKEFMTSCTDACRKALTDEEANKLVDNEPYIENCISDCELTLSYDFVDSHKMSYMSRFKAIADSIIKDPSIPEESPLKVEAKVAYVETTLSPTCGKGCGPNGVCTEVACECKEGWGGKYCDEELKPKGPVTSGDITVIGNRPIMIETDPAQEQHHQLTSQNGEEEPSVSSSDENISDWDNWNDNWEDWNANGGESSDSSGAWGSDQGWGDWGNDSGNWEENWNSDTSGDWSGDSGEWDWSGDDSGGWDEQWKLMKREKS